MRLESCANSSKFGAGVHFFACFAVHSQKSELLLLIPFLKQEED